jgi:DNA-binding HxlR family transcriptional regulator
MAMSMSPDHPPKLEQLAERIQLGSRREYEFLRSVFAALGGKWAVLVLLVLATGELRHAALRRSLDKVLPYEKISQRILTHRLREFEELGLLLRTTTGDVPPKVSYRLTEKGYALADNVQKIIDLLS